MKTAVFLLSVIVGGKLVDYFQYQVAVQKRAQQDAYKRNKPDYKYNPDMSAWREWRRQTANSGHPDWKRPEQGKADNFAGTFHVNPEKQKHLNILGLKTEVSPKKIHRQYLKMAKRYHPDALQLSNATVSEKQRAEEKMKEINAAYEWLKRNP